MALPSSGTISILDLAREKVYDNHADDRVPYTGGSNKHPKPLDGYSWVTSGNNCDLSRDTGQGIGVAGSGNSALKMLCTGTDSYTSSYGTSGYDLGTAAKFETWTFSVYAKASTSLTGQLFLFEAPSGGSITTFSNISISITTSWQRFEITRTLTQGNTQTVRVRVDGPQGSSSDTVYWDGFQVEEASSATNFHMNGPYSLTDLVMGTDSNSSMDFEATSTDSTSNPNTSTPHEMSEWYSYDHDAVRATAQILLHSNGSDPGTADSYSFGPFAGMSYSSIYRAVITNISGNTVITGNDAHFYLAASNSSNPTNYASPGSFSISSSYSTFYFRIRRNVDSLFGSDSTLITVTPALPSGGTRTADTIAINFTWGVD